MSGCSSGVERYLAKVEVESSSLFARFEKKHPRRLSGVLSFWLIVWVWFAIVGWGFAAR